MEETQRNQEEPQIRAEISSFELGSCPRQRHDFVIKEMPGTPSRSTLDREAPDFFMFCFWPKSVWGLSSQTRDRTRTPALEGKSEPLDHQGSPSVDFILFIGIELPQSLVLQ